jgi:hypothetical protein
MTVDGGRSAPAMAREWWAQLMVGGAIEVGSFGPAQDEHNGFPFIQKKFKWLELIWPKEAIPVL